MKVVLRGQGQVLDAVEITAENFDEFTDAVQDPRIGMWVVSDKQGYVKACVFKADIERMYEHAPKHYSTRPGWLDRPPEEMQKR